MTDEEWTNLLQADRDNLQADLKLMAEYYMDLQTGDCLYLVEAEDLLNKHGFLTEDGFFKEEN